MIDRHFIKAAPAERRMVLRALFLFKFLNISNRVDCDRIHQKISAFNKRSPKSFYESGVIITDIIQDCKTLTKIMKICEKTN